MYTVAYLNYPENTELVSVFPGCGEGLRELSVCGWQVTESTVEPY